MRAALIVADVEVEALRAAMVADDPHCCYRPTHILYDNDGVIRGAFSVALAPVLFFWMSSRWVDPVASMRGYRLAEAAVRALGHKAIILPIEAHSPFRAYVQAMGYHKLGDVELLEKELG